MRFSQIVVCLPIVCLICLLIIALMVPFVPLLEASRIYGSFKDANHPGSCVINDEIILPEMGTLKDPFVQCGLIVCGKNSIVELKSCPLETVPANCRLGDLLDISKPYPQCCKRDVKCSSADNNK